jgi:DNA-directed RNA polymerase beta subunit
MDTIAWNLIDKYFKDTPYNLVAHHLDSYNDFFSNRFIQELIAEHQLKLLIFDAIQEEIVLWKE